MQPVTVQCNASQSGLEAVLLQDGQPICYASHAFTDTKTDYVQIEKERLAIFWSCDKFDQYLSSRKRYTSHQSACNACVWPYRSTI